MIHGNCSGGNVHSTPCSTITGTPARATKNRRNFSTRAKAGWHCTRNESQMPSQESQDLVYCPLIEDGADGPGPRRIDPTGRVAIWIRRLFHQACWESQAPRRTFWPNLRVEPESEIRHGDSDRLRNPPHTGASVATAAESEIGVDLWHSYDCRTSPPVRRGWPSLLTAPGVSMQVLPICVWLRHPRSLQTAVFCVGREHRRV